MSLTEQEILRYSRHIILPEVGGRGQKRIKAASVLIAGLGAVGSAAALYLAAAGVGRITLWDAAALTEEDLTGAIAHARSRIGQNRAVSASASLAAINPDAAVTALSVSCAPVEAVGDHQVVMATMGDWMALQAEAIRCEVPLVFAGASGGSGAAMAYRPGEPCLGCVDEDRAAALGLRPEGATGAVSAAAGVIGVAGATEVIKLILGVGTPLTGRILAYDGWESRFREAPVVRREDCRLCR